MHVSVCIPIFASMRVAVVDAWACISPLVLACVQPAVVDARGRGYYQLCQRACSFCGCARACVLPLVQVRIMCKDSEYQKCEKKTKKKQENNTT